MVSKVVEEAQTYIAYGRTDQAVEVLVDALAEGLTSASLNMCLLECYVELEQFAEAGALLGRLEQGDSPELLERARQILLDGGMTLTSPSGDTVAQRSEERAEESEEASVLSELSFSAEPAFALNDAQNTEDASEVESVDVVEEVPLLDAAPSAFEDPLVPEKSEAGQAASLSSIEDEQGLQLAPLEGVVGDRNPETGADSAKSDETRAYASLPPDTSGLDLSPLDAGVDAAEIPTAESFDSDESIHGVETNPVDSKLDLARAYLDMGDEDGARPVLMEVIKEGDRPQQAEARELLLRLEAS
jgi:pilus assembly protein FimV